MTSDNWYFHGYQGQGSFIGLPQERPCHDGVTRKIWAVVTSGCRAGVGIYVRLNDKYCFMAHITAEIAGQSKPGTWQPTRQQGDLLRQLIVAKLQINQDLMTLVNSDEYKFQETHVVHGELSDHFQCLTSYYQQTSPTTMEEKKWYQHFKQGQARLITLSSQVLCHDGHTRELYAVGTCDCFTCVCIYAKLSEDSCFIAHIAAEILGFPKEDDDSPWQPTREQGALLTKAILNKLNSFPRLKTLVTAKEYRVSEDNIKNCSRVPKEIKGKNSAGKYIIQALQEFFGDVQPRKVNEFIVNHGNGDTQWLNRVAERVDTGDQTALDNMKPKESRTEIPSDHGWHSQNEDDYRVDNGTGSGDWHFVWLNGELVTNYN